MIIIFLQTAVTDTVKAELLLDNAKLMFHFGRNPGLFAIRRSSSNCLGEVRGMAPFAANTSFSILRIVNSYCHGCVDICGYYGAYFTRGYTGQLLDSIYTEHGRRISANTLKVSREFALCFLPYSAA